MTSPRWLGLDLGGTYIKVAALVAEDSEPTVLGLDRCDADADRGPHAVIDALTRAGTAAIARWGPFAAVGVGLPGLFDERSGAVELFPNLPGPWPGTPLHDPLTAALSLPVALVNDARAFTLAESRLGAAAGCGTVAAFVLGTGIGGGLVIDGRPHFGRDGRAGELAHQVIVPGGPRCGCGNHGCLEAVASSGALCALAGRSSPADVFAAAADGDDRARTAIETVADHLGVAIANVITMILPERVVLGGGVADAGDALFAPVRAAVARHCVLVPPDWYDIVPAQLGPHAGAIGAALWAAETHG